MRKGSLVYRIFRQTSYPSFSRKNSMNSDWTSLLSDLWSNNRKNRPRTFYEPQNGRIGECGNSIGNGRKRIFLAFKIIHTSVRNNWQKVSAEKVSCTFSWQIECRAVSACWRCRAWSNQFTSLGLSSGFDMVLLFPAMYSWRWGPVDKRDELSWGGATGSSLKRHKDIHEDIYRTNFNQS